MWKFILIASWSQLPLFSSLVSLGSFVASFENFNFGSTPSYIHCRKISYEGLTVVFLWKKCRRGISILNTWNRVLISIWICYLYSVSRIIYTFLCSSCCWCPRSLLLNGRSNPSGYGCYQAHSSILPQSAALGLHRNLPDGSWEIPGLCPLPCQEQSWDPCLMTQGTKPRSLMFCGIDL